MQVRAAVRTFGVSMRQAGENVRAAGSVTGPETGGRRRKWRATALGGGARRSVVRALLVAVIGAVITGSPVPAPAQLSSFSLSVGPALSGSLPGPPNVVGDQNRPGELRIINTSSGPGADNQPLPIANIRVDMACNTSTFDLAGGGCPAGQHELPTDCMDGQTTNPCPTGPGPAPVGRAGTACAGVTFTVTGNARTGTVVLTPSAPIILGPSNGSGAPPQCIIDFTFDVVGRPADGVSFAVGAVDFTPPGGTATPTTGASQQVFVNQAPPPTITTAAAPTGTQTPPVSTSDTATLTESVLEANPTGTVTFRLIGPNPDGACSTPIVAGSEQARPLNAAGTSASTSVSPSVSTPGVYNWIARYDGDTNFAASAFVGCGDPAERFTVALPTPSIDVQKTADPLSRPEPGGSFTFTVRVVDTGPTNVTINSINDNIYGNIADTANPNITATTCNTLIGTVLTANGGSAQCTFSANFTGAPRSQTDIATVNGTDSFGTQVTDNDDATITITAVNPALTVVKTANPTSRPEPGGAYTFTVQVTNTSQPGDPVTIQTINDNIYGNVANPANPAITATTCNTLIGTVLAVGASTSCTFSVQFTGAPRSQTDIVTVAGVDDENTPVQASDDATIQITPNPPSIDVLKTANPTSRPEPGGAYTFTVQVTNTSQPGDPVTIQTISDNIYGNVANPANPAITATTCNTLIGTVLAVGASTSCTFSANFTGAPRSQTDIVTVSGVDDENTPVSDSDDATIEITPLPPSLTISKAPAPASRPEPGGAFTFTMTITNTSGPSDPVTIQTLTDNVYGNLGAANPNITNNTCAALIGTVLAPGASTTCSFTGQFTGAPGASQTDTVTVTGVDDENTPVTASAQATVTITPSPPSITVVKTANPLSRPAPGGAFTFTVQITNTSGPTDPVTIQAINDNIYGNLGAANPNVTNNTCAALIGTVLAPGANTSCSFVGQFTGTAGASQTDIVIVSGVDDENTPVQASDDARVALTGGGSLLVSKVANPPTRPEPGGDFTYTFVVTNNGAVPVTIDTIIDDQYGNLATRPGSTCGALIGTTLAPGAASAPCSFTAPFMGNAGASLRDVVTVTGHDQTGNPVPPATDDEIVRITDVPPQIAVTKAASPLTRPAPGGTYTFTVQVRNPGTVEPLIITALTDNIYGNLATRPGSTCGALIGTTLAPGASSPTCTFTGDFTGAAGATQTDVVTATGRDDENNNVSATATATVGIASVTPQIVVTKTASPQSRPEPGGTFTFTVLVFNNGPVAVRITQITDNIYGNLATRAGSTCGTLINTTLAANGGSATCTFTGDFTGQPGASQTDIVTVTGVDTNGAPVTDDDDATVFITNQPSSIRLVKDASPASRPEPGGAFTFAVTVTNTSAVDNVTILTLTDNIYGNIGSASNTGVTANTCPGLIGRVLTPGQSANCSFTGVFTGRGGQSQTDVVTVTAVDDDNQPLTTNDDATVTLTRVPPVIDVQKDASPPSRPEPGGSFTFTVRITNQGVNRVVVSEIKDNVYGDLNGRGTCQIGATLQPFPGPGNVYVCSFSADFKGNAGASQTDVVTVTATDDSGTKTTDSDDAVVTITNLPPTITTTKKADPTTRPEPGGTFTFTFTLTNTSIEPVRITSLVDNVYGDLNGRGTCAIGSTLAAAPGPGNVYTCTFTGSFTGVGGQNQTDVITATVVDDENTPTTSTSTATVTLTTVPPTISVTKTPSPTSRPVPGGDFTFTVTVLNTSIKPVTVTSLVDNVFGNLNGRGTCAVGAVLQPSATYTCSFTVNIQSAVPGSQTDIVTAGAVDNQGNPAVGQAQATVRIEAPAATVLSETQQQQPLARTGMDLQGPAGLAVLMVAFGFILVGATWRSQRQQLAFTPAPDGFTPPPPPPASAGFGLGLGFGGGFGADDGPGPPRRSLTSGGALTLRGLGAALFKGRPEP